MIGGRLAVAGAAVFGSLVLVPAVLGEEAKRISILVSGEQGNGASGPTRLAADAPAASLGVLSEIRQRRAEAD
jgi:hypothetical protein